MRSVAILTSLLLSTLLLSTSALGSEGEAAKECGLQVTNYRGWKILRSEDLLVFTSGMAIDADGSPRAYHPDDVSGLDDLRHAGGPGHWQGLSTIAGEPIVQQDGDPAPSYYVSSTSLEDHSYPATSPRHFVDAEKIPYLALPEDLDGPELGDLAFVFNGENGRGSAAIFADEGPRPGEGSIALAKALGVHADARYGGAESGITFVVFLDSGEHAPLSTGEIDSRTQKLFNALDVKRLLACVADDSDGDTDSVQGEASE